MLKPIQKILFISFSAGAGHKRAAEALFLSCKQKYPQIQTEHIDLLDYSNCFFKKITASLYHFSVKYFPAIYGLAYKATNHYFFADLLNKLSGILRLNNLKLHSFVKNYSPDLIISTHFIVPAVVKDIVKSIPIDMVITDYGLHGVWLAPNVRNFYVAHEKIAHELQEKKIQAIATGLPVHPNFFSEKNIEILKTKFDLRPKEKTILIMSGGFGLKDQTRLIKKITSSFSKINLLVISGKDNDKLYQKYKNIQTPPGVNYQVIKFTDDIDELIRICDIVITKPGGITLAECAYLNKKIILTEPIPGQEETNEKYFTQNKLAVKLQEKNITGQIRQLLELPENKKSPTLSANDLILNEALKN
ncbi:MAG TPA: glycosyltransferase [Candidatus Magasanikbacteria bacterium]|nr:glycosyltransferase [Candidatus Magasanikbacteria bacterium]